MICYYKIYAQNIRTINPITEITGSEANKIILDVVGNIMDNMRLSDFYEYFNVKANDYDEITDDDLSKVQEKIRYELNKQALAGDLNCGDFCIVNRGSTPPTYRPKKCGMITLSDLF